MHVTYGIRKAPNKTLAYQVVKQDVQYFHAEQNNVNLIINRSEHRRTFTEMHRINYTVFLLSMKVLVVSSLFVFCSNPFNGIPLMVVNSVSRRHIHLTPQFS